MGFDNEKFTKWLKDFETALIDSGMPQHQAMRYRTEYYSDAVAHFAADRTPDDAAVRELLNI